MPDVENTRLDKASVLRTHNAVRGTMSKLELYFHIVWATQHRQPLLTPQKEEAVYRCALKLIHQMDYVALDINGMPDHVHQVLQSGPRIDLAELMKQVKGVTSAMVNDMTDHAERFRWQPGYFAETVSPSQLAKVRAYVREQKERHQRGDIHPAWEQTGETPDGEA
jgi:putative transposase